MTIARSREAPARLALQLPEVEDRQGQEERLSFSLEQKIPVPLHPPPSSARSVKHESNK